MIGWFDGGRGGVTLVSGRGGLHWLENMVKIKHRCMEGRRLGIVGKSDRDCDVWHVVHLGYRVVRLGYCVVRLREV